MKQPGIMNFLSLVSLLVIIAMWLIVPIWLKSGRSIIKMEPCSIKTLQNQIGFELPSTITDFNCKQIDGFVYYTQTWEFAASEHDIRLIVFHFPCVKWNFKDVKQISDSTVLKCEYYNTEIQVKKIAPDKYAVRVYRDDDY